MPPPPPPDLSGRGHKYLWLTDPNILSWKHTGMSQETHFLAFHNNKSLAHLSITGSMQALVSNSCRLEARCWQTMGSQGRCTCTCNGKEIKYIFRHKAPVRAGSAHIDNIYNPSCPWHECPGPGQILELSRNYISIQMYAM